MKHGHQQVFAGRAARDFLAAGDVQRIDERAIAGNRELLIEDHVADGLAVLAVPPDLQDARVGNLDGLFRQLHLIFPVALLVAQGRELVDPAQGRLVVGGDQPRADAPDADRGALVLEAGDELFVEVVGGHDGRLGKAGLVEHSPGLDAQPGQVAGVQPDADHLVPLPAHLLADFDRVPHASERVVGVHQEHAIVGHGLGVGPEGFQFVVEAHHPAMGVRAQHGDAEQAAGEDVGRGAAAAQVGCPAGRQGPVDSLGAAEAEFQHRLAVCRQINAGRLGGHERLEVDDVQSAVSSSWAWTSGPVTRKSGSWGKTIVPSGMACTSHSRRISARYSRNGRLEERLLVVSSQGGQIGQVFGVESQSLQKLDGRGQAGGNRETAAEGIASEEEVKHRFLLAAARLPVGVAHRELVEVREQPQGGFVQGLQGVHVPLCMKCLIALREQYITTSMAACRQDCKGGPRRSAKL